MTDTASTAIPRKALLRPIIDILAFQAAKEATLRQAVANDSIPSMSASAEGRAA